MRSESTCAYYYCTACLRSSRIRYGVLLLFLSPNHDTGVISFEELTSFVFITFIDFFFTFNASPNYRLFHTIEFLTEDTKVR